MARRTLRCVESDIMLYKGEYSPNVVKPKIQSLGIDFVPELRLSRKVQLIEGQSSSFFLIVSNGSIYPMKVILKGEHNAGDANCIDCSAFALEEFIIPSKDDTADIDNYLQQGESNE